MTSTTHSSPESTSFNCPNCGQKMQEERQHFRCTKCGFIEPCCEGGPL